MRFPCATLHRLSSPLKIKVAGGRQVPFNYSTAKGIGINQGERGKCIGLAPEHGKLMVNI